MSAPGSQGQPAGWTTDDLFGDDTVEVRATARAEDGDDNASAGGGASVSVLATTDTERLVKSQERVRDLAEVFTPASTVQDMLDLLPDEIWAVHPSATFLEPSCGDGNFLVAVLDRKLSAVSSGYAAGTLPGGRSADAALFHALEALASIYAVDISLDNVVGGTPGHEIGARTRMVMQLQHWHEAMFGKRLTSRTLALRAAQWIVEHNILVGNMLARQPDGSPSGRSELPLKVYSWEPARLAVVVHETTLGAVMSETQTDTTGVMSLFGPPEPTLLWQGKAFRLHEASGGLAGPTVGRGKK